MSPRLDVISAAENPCPLVSIRQYIIPSNLLLHLEGDGILIVIGAKWMFALLAWALNEMSSFSPPLGFLSLATPALLRHCHWRILSVV